MPFLAGKQEPFNLNPFVNVRLVRDPSEGLKALKIKLKKSTLFVQVIQGNDKGEFNRQWIPLFLEQDAKASPDEKSRYGKRLSVFEESLKSTQKTPLFDISAITYFVSSKQRMRDWVPSVFSARGLLPGKQISLCIPTSSGECRLIISPEGDVHLVSVPKDLALTLETVGTIKTWADVRSRSLFLTARDLILEHLVVTDIVFFKASRNLTNLKTVLAKTLMTVSVGSTLDNQLNARLVSKGKLEVVQAPVLINEGVIKAALQLTFRTSVGLHQTATGELSAKAAQLWFSEGSHNQGRIVGETVHLTGVKLNNEVSGKILGQKIEVTGNLSLENGGLVEAQRALLLKTQATVINQATGVLKARDVMKLEASKIINLGKIQSLGLLSVRALQLIDNQTFGKILAQKSFELGCDEIIQNQGVLETAGSLKCEAKSFVQAMSSGQISSGKSLFLLAKEGLENAGEISGDVVTLLVKKGLLKQTSGAAILGEKDIFLESQILSNEGLMESSAGGLFVKAEVEFVTLAMGNLKAHQAIRVTAGRWVNEGTLETQASLDGIAESMVQTQTGKMMAQETLSLHSKGAFQNAGMAYGRGAIRLSADSMLENKPGAVLETDGTFDITRTLGIRNSGKMRAGARLIFQTPMGLHQQETGELSAKTLNLCLSASSHNQGRIVGETVNLTGVKLENGVSGKILGFRTEVTGNLILDNQGWIESREAFLLNTQTKMLNQATGVLKAGKIIKLNAESLLNAGKIQSLELLQVITLKRIDNQASGQLLAHKTFELKCDALIQNRGVLKAGSVLRAEAPQIIQDVQSGKMFSEQDLILTANQRLENLGGLYGKKTLHLSSESVYNAGEIMSTEGEAVLESEGIFENTATGRCQGQTIFAANVKALKNAGVLHSEQRLTLKTKASLENLASGKISSRAGTLVASPLCIANHGYIESLGEVVGEAPQIILGTSGRIASNEPLILTAEHFIENAGNLLGKKVLLSVTDKKAGCVRNLETGRVVGVESLDLQVAKLEQTGRLESGQNIIFTGNTFSHVKGTIETGRNLQVTAVDIGVTATAKAVGDIHLIHQGGKWEVSEAVQAQGTLIFYLPDKKIHVIDKPFHSKAGSLCYRSRHSGNALSFLANQQAKADFAFEGFSEVTIGSQTHKPTLLAGGVLSAAVAQLDFHQGRLLSEKGMRLKSAGAMVLGRVSTTFEAAIQSHGTIELEAGKNIDWHSLNLVTEGHLRVKGTILDDISSDVYVRGDVNLEVPLSRHRLLVESHVEQPYPYAPSGGKPFWRRNPWIPRMKAGLDGWHSCPVNWSAFECRRRLEGKMRATTRPAKLMMGGALHYSGQLEVFGSQIACASLKGIAPKISHCIPYESYRRASLCGHRKRRKAHWEYHQSPEVTFGAPILGAVSVASNLKVTAQRVDISGILSALSIGITGIEQGRIGQFEAFVNLGPMVSRPFRNQVPLLDYFEPSPLYEISLGGPTLFKSVLPRGVTPMIPRLVLRSDGTLSPNTAGLSRLFTPEQEVMLLTKSLMGELGRHFLSRELSDTNHILQYLESNALQYSAQNKRLTQASGVSEPAMMVRSSGKSHAIEIQRKGSATTVSSVLPNPCLVDQVITFMFEDGQTVSCLVPVLYLPNRFNNPRLKDSAGCLFSLGDIELSGTPGAQLHLRGNMDAEGLVTYQDFEVVSRTRNTWTRYETIIHESKQKRLTGSKTTTTEELVAITELQSGNALVAKGERYLNVNVVHRSAVKDTLGSEGLVVKNATAFVDEGIVRNQIGPRISVKQKGCLGLGSTEVSRTLVRQQVLGSEIETAGPIRIEAQYGQLDATQIHRVKNAEGVEPKIIFEIAELHFHELLQAVAANNRASERLLLSSLQEQARTAKRKAIQGMTKLVISLPVAYYTSGFISSYLQGSMGVTMKVATVSATVPLATTPQAMTIVGLSGLGAGLTSSLVVGANPLKGAVQRGLSSLVGYGVANASLLAGHEVVQEVVRGSVVGSVSAVMNHQDVLSSLLIGGVASGVGSWVFSGENPDLLSTQIGKSLLEGEVAVVASNGTLEDLAMNLMSSSLGAWMGKSISDIGSRHGASLGLQTSMEIIPAVPVKKKERSFGYAETQSQSLSYWDAITLVTEDAWSQLAKQGHFVSRERIREAFEEHPVLQGNPEHIPAKLELLGRAAPPHGVRLSRTEAIQRGVGKVFNATLALVAGEAQASSTEKFYYSRGSNFKVTDLFTQGSSVSHSTDIWREGLPSVSVATSTQNRATSKVMRFQNLESAVQETTRILKAQGVRVSREKVVQVLTTHPDLKVPNQTIDDRLIELGYINGKIEGMPKSSREAFNRGLENFIRYNQESFTTSARHQEVREQTLLQRDSGNLSSNPLSKSSRHRSDLGTGLRRGAAHAFINTLNTLTPEAQALEVNIRHKQSPKGLDCRLVALKSLWSSDNPEILASCQRQNRTTMPTLAYGADALHLAREEIQVGERVLGGLQAATGIGQMGLGLAIAVVPGVGPVVGTGLGTLGADNVMSGLQTVTTGKPAPTLLFRGLQKVGEKTELYGSMGAAYLEMGVNLTSPAATPKVVEGAGKALTFAFRPGVKASPRAPEIFSEVSLVQKSLQTTTTPSSLTMWDRFRQISTSSPGEIAWGYGNLSSKQAKILLELPTPGSIVQLHKSHITVTDLAALTAKTGDEFAMFTLGSRRLIVRGNSFGLRIEEELLFKFQSEGWTWSAHVHPGTKDIVLNASGIPGDRNALILFEQSQSLILNSTGRRNLFNLTDDIRITPKTDNSHNVFPKNPGSNKQ